MPRKATIGPETFKRVNELVAKGKRRSEAFAQVGDERNSTPGTVAANYYRVARAQGQGGAKRRGASTRQRSSSTPRASRAAEPKTNGRRDSDISRVAEEIAKLTRELVRQVEERDQKLRSLLG